ncbi:MAG: NAD kinase [Lutimonas sp.]
MKVGIFGQKNNKTTLKYIHTLVELLLKYDTTIVFEENIFEYFSKKFPGFTFQTFKDYHDLDNTYDMFYSVGGDGTFLRSITFIRDHNIPIIGINTGRLGFLATVQKEQIVEAVYQINQGNYKIKERSVLSLQTNDQNPDVQEINIALNEIAITRKNTASMITVETYLDDEFLTTYWSDGLIISTPTGSTGYSLSCGGPIISPSSKNIVLTPIAPHSLSVRPLVIPESTKIELHIGSRSKEAILTLDSRMTTISNSTKILISKADFTIKTLHLNSQTFIKTLREKLLWGQDKRN